MPTVHRTTLVPYTREQMFALVNDIERYPEFLPWCPKSEVHYREKNQVKATLYIAKGIVHRSFTTINTLTEPEKVEIHLDDGPFKHLSGFWEFKTTDALTHSDFYINFEFNNRLLDMGFAPIFKQITQTMVSSFTQRAHDIYGNN